MELKIRKLVNFEEEIRFERERAATPPLRMSGTPAVGLMGGPLPRRLALTGGLSPQTRNVDRNA